MNDEIIKEYLSGKSLPQLAKEHNSSTYLIKKFLISKNIKIRTASEQTAISNLNRAISINDSYFSILTLENVYYLGFYAADGTVRPDCNEIKITLNIQDETFLQELLRKIEYKGKLHYSSGPNTVELRFSSKQIKEDFAKYSIVPRKTYLGITISNIPDKYKLAFIKGYFDGDGSVSINKDTKQVSVKICSHTKKILEEFQAVIKQKSSIYQRSDDGLFTLELSTIPSLAFLKEIYSLDTPCLQRKYNKYLEILNIRI